MAENTIEKVYIKLILTTKSPFSVCSGMDEFSDKDIIKRGDEPFIPGSTLAGVFRNYIKMNGLDSSSKSIDEIDKDFFGYIHRGDSKEEHKARQSGIIFGDGVLAKNGCSDSSASNAENPKKESEPKFIISFRDGVKLGDRKTAIDTGKYNYEIIEKGAKFEAIIEYHGKKADVFKELIKQIAIAINSGEIRIGSKVSRGLGYMGAEYIEKTFGKGKVNDWLEFDPYCSSKWKDGKFTSSKDLGSKKIYGIEADIEIPDTLMIRDYNVDPNIIIENNSEKSMKIGSNSKTSMIDEKNSEGEKAKSYPNIEKLDYGQLCSSCINDNAENQSITKYAVIPGTTWAGAFSHRAKVILEEILYSMNLEDIGVDVINDKDKAKLIINEKVKHLLYIAFGQIENAQTAENVQSNNIQNSSTNNISDNINKENEGKDDKNKKQFCKSNLSFFDSEIKIKNENDNDNPDSEYAKIIPITRTKIDRFTGGSMPKALFTENVCCGGKTTLKIGINKNCKEKKAVMGLIFLCLDDLKDGLLAIGGETAVGRGIIKVNHTNIHEDIKEELVKDFENIEKDKLIEIVREQCLKSLVEELRK